jgi:hypothetical protein
VVSILGEIDDALDTVRMMSNLTDAEYAELVRICHDRANGVVVGTTLTFSGPENEAESVDPGQLNGIPAFITQHELAGILGVPAGTCRQWKQRGKLPEPDELISGRPCWARATVRRFADELRQLA